jgi:hypothetical protein
MGMDRSAGNIYPNPKERFDFSGNLYGIGKKVLRRSGWNDLFREVPMTRGYFGKSGWT